MNSGGEDILDAVLPILKLLCIAGMGFILSHPKIDMVPKSTYKILSGLVFVLFLPCLIFIYLAQSICLENFVLWWFIPVNVVVSTAIGCILGLLVALICRPPPQFFRFTIIMTAFGNTGYIPLAVVSSFCRNTDNPFGTDCSANGVAYVSFSQWVSVVLAYTLVYHMMEPPLEYYEIGEEEEGVVEEINEIVQEEHVDNCQSTPLLVEAEWPGLEDKETEHCKTPFIARLFNSISLTNIPDDLDSIVEENKPNGSKSIKCLAEPKMVKKMRIVAVNTPLRHILQPPVFASVLAILVGIIPRLKSIVFSSDSPLEVLTDSLDIISEATVPSIMLVIGGMLLEGPNESKLGTRTTVGIIIARLLVLPLIGIGVLYLADKWHFLIQDDQLYRFVLFLQYTTPSAILLAAIASLRGYAVGEASAILFWQHVFAMFSLALYLFIYIKLSFVYS
ncbi:Auxin efflux carrier family protein [Melia azedarach]|uniref:Auxin efflux carrier family protein n=2 Tax=Melia azedarach TaxID=155640 RepID=A0ACC1X6R1_MELAZ|nr:Auxin efflux carrier family protein [Melia azedarach]KAJ4706989.1 Auxin efflux carrier family protein [Melia azedarach]